MTRPLQIEDGVERYKRTFKANPVQRAFIRSRARADCFFSRFGEGKTAGLVMACFHHTQKNPGARWAMIRDTWENLRDTTQKEFFDWFPSGICGEYMASTKTWKWRMGGMRGEVQWLGMDDEKDAAKLQSRALGGFGMDEPAPAAHSGGIAKFIFTTACGRLRQPGMAWYAAKHATNNPDETHWTYETFVEPGTPGFKAWQTQEPENEANLPENYYDRLMETYRDRPDLQARFVKGEFGFQQLGRPVTPAWSDRIHLASHLEPRRGHQLHLLWDFGLNPTCVVTQIAGHWYFLDALVGEDVGAMEFIRQEVKPLLSDRYHGFSWDHTHDPTNPRDQSSSEWTPVRVIREELGGSCYPGAVDIQSGVDPLNYVLSQLRDDAGLVQVDRVRARTIWHALRGGWHYPVRASTGTIHDKPVKNIHSHPGDACRYGASRFFPLGRLRGRRSARAPKRAPRYFGGLRFPQAAGKVPKEAETIPPPGRDG